MKIDAKNKHFKILNDEVRNSKETEITIDNCNGQRYIAAGQKNKKITINGVPGNALAAYLDGAEITVFGDAQDATGDTMNEGKITVYGSTGDATGYSMRGGEILIRGNAGYRAGIHMKEYQKQRPVLIIGNEAGSFLGEYQSGGTIIVLGLHSKKTAPVGNLCGTGMCSGKMYLRAEAVPADLPKQVSANKATEADMKEIDGYLDDFCKAFDVSKKEILSKLFIVLTPNSKNPYKQSYTFY